jgi:4-hydroxybenzoyl-CoA thioesterase
MLTNKRTFSVEFGHCDPSGIVYNPNYFIWFDQAVHALLAAGRIDLKSFMSDHRIDGIPVVEYKVRFLAPSRWGDELVIESGVEGLQRCALTVQHRILNGGVVAVECTETRVCTEIDAQSGRPKARSLPDAFVTALSGSGLPG